MNLRPQAAICLVALFTLLLGAWAQSPLTPPPKRPLPVIGERVSVVPSVERINPPAVDCSTVACLAFTFDDGPDPVVTGRILDVLAANQAHATFFLVGSRAADYPDTVRRIYREGHEIGNHSWGHPDLTKLSPDQVEYQVRHTQEAIMSAGVPAPHLFRPPYGAMSPMVKTHVPMALVLWNIDPEDWGEKDPNKIAKRIEDNARPGRIVVMHDVHGPTAEALAPALQTLKGQYQFVTVSEMFDITPGQRGEFYGR